MRKQEIELKQQNILKRLESGSNKMPQNVTQINNNTYNMTSKDLLNKVRGYFGSSDYNNAPEVMRKTLVSLVNSDISHLLPNISCPTLLIWGSNDTAVPVEDAKKMEKLIPDAGLCVLDGCSHFALIERPYDIELILDSFIK